jgi:hypothetical protein
MPNRYVLSNTHLLAYNIYDTLNVILPVPQQIFERRATLVWVSDGCLGARLRICNPHFNGVGDIIFCTIRDFFIIGHLLGANMNEWVEVVAEAERGHVRLGYLG